MKIVKERITRSFEERSTWLMDNIKYFGQFTNIHYVMFGLCTRSVYEAFAPTHRRNGICNGNLTLDQCEEIIEFVDEFICGEFGLKMGAHGSLEKTNEVGLLDEEVEEVLYIWDRIIKTEYVAFEILQQGDEESYRSHREYAKYLRNKLKDFCYD